MGWWSDTAWTPESKQRLLAEMRERKREGIVFKLDATGAAVAAGNVTIPPNHALPPVGGVVEVRYLYAFPESGRLFQPVYLGARDDVLPAECATSQLKFKSEDE